MGVEHEYRLAGEVRHDDPFLPGAIDLAQEIGGMEAMECLEIRAWNWWT